MFELSFEIGGRKVSPDQIGNALEKAALQAVQEAIRKKVGSARCPVHGSAARIVARGRRADSLTFDVHGCCTTLIEQVKAALR
jgi:hypothetical protein